jgi:hypothetical protein
MDNQEVMTNLPDVLLPRSDKLNITALSRLFNNTTNSYKYIFFISLLDILSRRNFNSQEPISFNDLTIEMLANAWFPHVFFKLSFGVQDTIAKKLDSLVINIEEPVINFKDTDKKLLRMAISEAGIGNSNRLMEYVPYRLLVPFLETELSNIDKSKWMVLELAMPAIANNSYKIKYPLYKFDSDNYKDCKNIYINPLWCEYIKDHYSIIYGWTSWNWLQYMQKRNPSTPGVSNKLFMPVVRNSLTKQINYWKKILDGNNGQELRCIYSGVVLRADSISMDHYLPWSFVAHDQLWNLIPTLPSVNSSKSNNLPDERYFNSFVKMQHEGLLIANKIFSPGQFDKQTEHFIVDLALQEKNDLLEFEKLQNAYKRTIGPLALLAINQGFSNGWYYN